MMPVGFGWSAGDIAKAISILNRAYKALNDTGGAVSEYQTLAANIRRYILVLEALQGLTTEGLNPSTKNALIALAGTARSLLVNFEQHELCNYELAFTSRTKKKKFAKFARKAQYTFDIPKKVSKLLQELGMVLDQILVVLNMSVL